MTQNPRDDERPEQVAESNGPTIRDKRRIDPQTYQVRQPQDTAAAQPGPGEAAADEAVAGAARAGAAAGGDFGGDVGADTVDGQEPNPVDRLTFALAERTADLQRLQAEYVNYKRRVDRDRDLSRIAGMESVLRELLPVLDSVGSAREHGELTGGFKGVAEELEKVAARHGLVAYGEPGEPFDPNVHDALMHVPAPAGGEPLTGPTCVQILQPGYKIGDRIVRPARVAVAEPEEAPAAPAQQPEPETVPTAEQTAQEQDGPGGAADQSAQSPARDVPNDEQS